MSLSKRSLKNWLFGLGLLLVSSQAAAGLTNVRYQLSANPEMFWDSSPDAVQLKKSLRELAEFGVRDAQMLLADQLSRSSSFVHLREAIVWYQRAYEGGRNDAPGSAARIADNNSLLHREVRPYLRKVALTLSPEKDLNSVSSLLEIYKAYPELADPDRHKRLLELYKRACINTCFPGLFSAQVAELNNREKEALVLYEQAAVSSGRGVNAYFEFLVRFEDRNSRFQAFADNTFVNAGSLSSEVVLAIAGRLQDVGSEFNPSAIVWLDLAIERGTPNASVRRIEYMLSAPENFSFEETKSRIERIKNDHPIRSKLLMATLLTTRQWRELDPYKAYDLLKGLEDRKVIEAHIGMGDLYSMGGLDEVDQFMAIEEYKKAARKGYGSAFYKIATIYRYGRSICQDKATSYAYAQMALMLGVSNAEGFNSALESELELGEMARAQQLYQELVAAYPVEGFE